MPASYVPLLSSTLLSRDPCSSVPGSVSLCSCWHRCLALAAQLDWLQELAAGCMCSVHSAQEGRSALGQLWTLLLWPFLFWLTWFYPQMRLWAGGQLGRSQTRRATWRGVTLSCCHGCPCFDSTNRCSGQGGMSSGDPFRLLENYKTASEKWDTFKRKDTENTTVTLCTSVIGV